MSFIAILAHSALVWRALAQSTNGSHLRGFVTDTSNTTKLDEESVMNATMRNDTGLPTCEGVWNTDANGHTCGQRIQWLQNFRHTSEGQAKNQVAAEFPVECGSCGSAAPALVPSPLRPPPFYPHVIDNQTCMDTPSWNNGWSSCQNEYLGGDRSTCVPGQGWTCAAYVARGWCRKNRCLPPSETGGIYACGHTLNSPEWNCCECGKPILPPGSSPCCASCTSGIPGFCSPITGDCHSSNDRGDYQSCPAGGLQPWPMPRANTSNSSIKVMSYNFMGWNAFNKNPWRSQNVLGKIKDWDPDVLGAQEVEMGGGQRYEDVKDIVVNTTGLSHAGGSAFFNTSKLEINGTEWIKLASGHWADYWISMTRYKHKESRAYFLFFDSHWKHGYGMEQASNIAALIHDKRMEYGSPPTLLVGDTNQFCHGHEKEAIRYLKGEVGFSPVTFVDAIFHDRGRSFGKDCRVDFIFASTGQWSWVQSFIDREGMGDDGTASDHAALMAELVPLF